MNRQKTLFDEKITSQKNYLKAESDYKSARWNDTNRCAKNYLCSISFPSSSAKRGNIDINYYRFCTNMLAI
jgi:cobalt-zinc-cadmium efflux system membrane fusion protein